MRIEETSEATLFKCCTNQARRWRPEVTGDSLLWTFNEHLYCHIHWVSWSVFVVQEKLVRTIALCILLLAGLVIYVWLDMDMFEGQPQPCLSLPSSLPQHWWGSLARCVAHWMSYAFGSGLFLLLPDVLILAWNLSSYAGSRSNRAC